MKNKSLNNENMANLTRRERILQLKVCGMKFGENIREVANLQPDYMGFIFYEKSPRFVEGILPEISGNIKKVGVFVNAGLSGIIDKIDMYDLQAVQLHGSEPPDLCKEIAAKSKARNLEVIKAFSIKDEFDFTLLEPYEQVCDFFLFDTKGKNPGGNGYVFDWNVLRDYPSKKPYFLSGGIGLEEMGNLEIFLKSGASKYCTAIDVNSRFELEAGLKDVGKLNKFKNKII